MLQRFQCDSNVDFKQTELLTALLNKQLGDAIEPKAQQATKTFHCNSVL
jgi:hypothetical protein